MSDRVVFAFETKIQRTSGVYTYIYIYILQSVDGRSIGPGPPLLIRARERVEHGR